MKQTTVTVIDEASVTVIDEASKSRSIRGNRDQRFFLVKKEKKTHLLNKLICEVSLEAMMHFKLAHPWYNNFWQ